MSVTPLELETFPEKLERVEKVLTGNEEDNERFLGEKSVSSKVKGMLIRASSVPCCEFCDTFLKSMKLFGKVLVFFVGIAAFVFLLYKVSPFFSSIYGFFSGIYDFFVGAFEWIGSFLGAAYDWLLSSFDSISSFFVEIMDFFEDLPDLIEGFFSSFFLDIKGILDKIDPTEKLNSLGNTLQGFASNAKDAVGGVVDDAGDWLGGLIG
jgi:hypothetical protein